MCLIYAGAAGRTVANAQGTKNPEEADCAGPRASAVAGLHPKAVAASTEGTALQLLQLHTHI